MTKKLSGFCIAHPGRIKKMTRTGIMLEILAVVMALVIIILAVVVRGLVRLERN